MIPIRVHTIVISTQHDEGVTQEQIAKDLMEQVIKPVVPAKYLDEKVCSTPHPLDLSHYGTVERNPGMESKETSSPLVAAVLQARERLGARVLSFGGALCVCSSRVCVCMLSFSAL